jgi:hypothetical protein
VIHLRVVSPPDVTGALMPVLRSEPAVMNLTMLRGVVSHPDGDAVHFDVLQGAANEVIGRLRDFGLDQRGSIVLENVDTSISALADRATARRGRFQQFMPVSTRSSQGSRWRGPSRPAGSRCWSSPGSSGPSGS